MTTALTAALAAADQADTTTAKICAFLEALPPKVDTPYKNERGEQIFYATDFTHLVRLVQETAIPPAPAPSYA